MIAVVVVTIAGLLFGISLSEWIAIFICFSLVLSLETINTVVEDICNKLRDDLGLSYDSTRNARDIAAGAVLISAMFSVYIAIIIFLPKILELLTEL
jgi:diacylglycerol kinase